MLDSLIRLAPSVPYWVLIQRDEDMQVDDQVVHCVAFLGAPVSHGFGAEGTCFFLSLKEGELGFVYAVSAKHIVQPFLDERKQTPNDEPIWIRAQRKAGPPDLIETKRSDWICHPDRHIDICVHPVNWAKWDAGGDLALTVLSSGISLTKEL